MELFNKKFVYFMWDDNLKGKKGYILDDIKSIKEIVNSNQGNIDVIDYSGDDTNPFKEEGLNIKYKFAYYDPNYDIKIAYNEGKVIQFKDTHSDYEWKDCVSIEGFIDDNSFQFRVRPNNIKWWIMPNFDWDEQFNSSIGLNYFIEEQKDSYSRSRPPLKSDFNSKEEAERWLKNYLNEEKLFDSAIVEIDNLGSNLSMIKDKLKQHKMISEDDWTECFRMFNESKINGELAEVTK